MQTFVNDDLRFEVTDRGPADGPVVILLHGFPQSAASWDGVAPHLVDAGYRVLAPNQRGYSPDARPPGRGSYRMSLLVGDVMALADAAGADRFHLVGHDWGAAVAWSIAAGQPERVESLTTLSVPHPRAFAKSMVRSGQVLKSWYMFAFQVPGIERLVFTRAGALFERFLESSGMPEAARAAARERLGDPEAFGAALNWYRAAPLERGLPDPVSVPTTHVWSTGDVALTRRGAELTGDYCTGPYRLEILDGVTHWIPEEVPERTAEIILERARSAS